MRGSTVIFVLAAITSVNCASRPIIFHDKTLYEDSACQTADNRNGICSLKCSTLTLSQLHDRSNICGFKKRDVIVCCPKVLFDESVKYPIIEQACIDSNQKKEERIRESDEIKRRIQNEEKEYKAFSKDYLSIVPANNKKNVLDCEEEAKKIGGERGESYMKWCNSLYILHNAISSTSLYLEYPNEYPHMAAIGAYQLDVDVPISWDCSGTLIHASFVVTSASCILGRNSPSVVRVGAIDLLEDKRGVYDVDYAVEKTFVHGDYNQNDHKNDIALLKIRRLPEKQKGYYLPPLPACIWTEQDYPSERLLMMGYGTSGFEKEYTTRLYQKNFTSIEKCLKFHSLDWFYLNHLSTKDLCAGNSGEETNQCEDNFGAPLLINGENEKETPYVVGISTRDPLCLERTPETITKLHDHLKWMEEIMRDNQ